MSTTNSNTSGNPILDNPGVTAVIFAIIVACTFIGALYNSATSQHGGHHEEGGHGDAHSGEHAGEHKAAPAAAH